MDLDLIRGLKYEEDINYICRLIQNGADVNAIYTRYRHTSLIAASGFNNHANLQAIKLLIENGADVNVVDIYGVTPLMYAAGIQKHSMSNIEAFKLLLENGADMSTANIDGHTVFTVCKYPNNIDNLYLFQSAINVHYIRENLTYMATSSHSTAAASNHSTTAASSHSTAMNTIGKFIKISNGSRQYWKRHINSFLSLDIEECA